MTAITGAGTGLLTEIGVGGLVAYLIIKLVLEQWNKRNTPTPNTAPATKHCWHPSERQWDELVKLTKKTHKEVNDLWEWHNKEDDDGRKLWYSDRHLAPALEKLADIMEGQAKIMHDIHTNQMLMSKDLVELRARITQGPSA